jgi:hypothetical protein
MRDGSRIQEAGQLLVLHGRISRLSLRLRQFVTLQLKRGVKIKIHGGKFWND